MSVEAVRGLPSEAEGQVPPHHGPTRGADAVLVPIVVDLDGTLVATDTLVESVIKLVKRSPLNLLRMLLWLPRGRAAFKAETAAHVTVAAALLPFNGPLLAYLRAEKGAGRRIVLATAAHESNARRVSEHLDLFDDIIASDGLRNLKGSAKLAAIQDKVGNAFIYAGDSPADIPIWEAAEQAILVSVGQSAEDALQGRVSIARIFPRPRSGLVTWMRALRLHQWAKNTLLLVPLLTSFGFLQIDKIATSAAAFLAFSLAASASYILNDLWDLDSDRAHPRKRLRPFASGTIPITRGLLVAMLGLASATLIAAALSQAFIGMLLGYLVLTTAYSLVLKEYVLMDVILLALLYTYRILAGAVAIGVGTSAWLLAFSVFLFLSLALVKRCSELVALQRAGRGGACGRDYQVSDLIVLWPFGIGAALSAVVVFGLFINAPETQARYGTPQLLWLAAVGLIYWMGRLWIKTSRGEMHDDPLVFAVRDRGSRIVVFGIILVTLVAHFLVLGGV
jgi:4-hydroxybenzoate polyprenyltransferase